MSLERGPTFIGPQYQWAELDEKSNNDIYYDEPYHGSSANSPNYPLQADEKLRSGGEFANPDEINFMTDASLAFHT